MIPIDPSNPVTPIDPVPSSDSLSTAVEQSDEGEWASGSGTTCYLGLGGNLGNPMQLFDAVVEDISRWPQANMVCESPRYQSQPLNAPGPQYTNSVIELVWSGSPDDLLQACLNLEAMHGRTRTTKNAPRTVDLDLLLFGQAIIQTTDLTVPHPRMHLRRFVLEPLQQLNPGLDIPIHGPVRTLLQATLNQPLWPAGQ
ncbi:MAG: 2-amino-4-hydroxy-6-hydroxymethyldihydropteridine diphosphokinase [Limnobacter sp.]|nr:2-amino-4-hydroxy-6-hydroxymethyldihydropteridine diphosphokinase [Limnobacter sp.]